MYMLCNLTHINDNFLLRLMYPCKWPVAIHSWETATSKQFLKLNLHRPVILNKAKLNSNRTSKYSQTPKQMRSPSAEAHVPPDRHPENVSQLFQDGSIFTRGSSFMILGGHILSESSFAKNRLPSEDIACKSPT